VIHLKLKDHLKNRPKELKLDEKKEPKRNEIKKEKLAGAGWSRRQGLKKEKEAGLRRILSSQQIN